MCYYYIHNINFKVYFIDILYCTSILSLYDEEKIKKNCNSILRHPFVSISFRIHTYISMYIHIDRPTNNYNIYSSFFRSNCMCLPSLQKKKASNAGTHTYIHLANELDWKVRLGWVGGWGEGVQYLLYMQTF